MTSKRDQRRKQVTTKGRCHLLVKAHVQGLMLRTLTQPLPEGEERKVFLFFAAPARLPRTRSFLRRRDLIWIHGR